MAIDSITYISRIPLSIYKYYIHRNKEQQEQEYKLDMLLLEQVLFEYLLLVDKLLLEHS